MSTLDEVRERDAKYTVLDMKWSGTPEATKDRRFLLSQLDALQAENDALKAAVKAAGPALEAAMSALGDRQTEVAYANDGRDHDLVCDIRDQIDELRALLGLVI